MLPYESFEGEGAADQMEIQIGTRDSVIRSSSVRPIVQKLDITNAVDSTEMSQRITAVMAKFLEVNESTLARVHNPVHSSNINVIIGSNKQTQMASAFQAASGLDYAVEIFPGVRAHVISEGENKWLVGFFDAEGNSLYHDVDAMQDTDYQRIVRDASRTVEYMSDHLSMVPGDYELIENAAAQGQPGYLRGGYTTYVEAPSAHHALMKAVLQKSVNPTPFHRKKDASGEKALYQLRDMLRAVNAVSKSGGTLSEKVSDAVSQYGVDAELFRALLTNEHGNNFFRAALQKLGTET